MASNRYPGAFENIRNYYENGIVDLRKFCTVDAGAFYNRFAIASVVGVVAISALSVYLYKSLQSEQDQKQPLMTAKKAGLTSVAAFGAASYGAKCIFDWSKSKQLFLLRSETTSAIAAANFKELMNIGETYPKGALSHLAHLTTPFSDESRQILRSILAPARAMETAISTRSNTNLVYCIAGIALASVLLYRVLTAEKKEGVQNGNVIN